MPCNRKNITISCLGSLLLVQTNDAEDYFNLGHMVKSENYSKFPIIFYDVSVFSEDVFKWW